MYSVSINKMGWTTDELMDFLNKYGYKILRQNENWIECQI